MGCDSIGMGCDFDCGWKNKTIGICFVRWKLGEYYVDLTVCENRC